MARLHKQIRVWRGGPILYTTLPFSAVENSRGISRALRQFGHSMAAGRWQVAGAVNPTTPFVNAALVATGPIEDPSTRIDC